MSSLTPQHSPPPTDEALVHIANVLAAREQLDPLESSRARDGRDALGAALFLRFLPEVSRLFAHRAKTWAAHTLREDDDVRSPDFDHREDDDVRSMDFDDREDGIEDKDDSAATWTHTLRHDALTPDFFGDDNDRRTDYDGDNGCGDDNDCDDAKNKDLANAACPAPLTQTERMARTLQTRVAAILAHHAAPPLSPQDVAVIIGTIPSGPHARLEDAALSVCMRAYAPALPAVWRTLFRSDANTDPDGTLDLATVCLRSADADGLDDLAARGVLRHEIVSQLSHALHHSSCVLRVLRHIDIIKFAVDWNASFSPQRTKFCAALFEAQPAIQDQLNAIPAHAHAAFRAAPAFNDAYTAWRRKYECVVTSRNRFHRLYNMFGAAVLMDPVWDVERRRSRHFGKLLSALDLRLSDTVDTGVLYATSKLSLIAVLDVITEPPVLAHVTAFLEDYPPSG